MILLRAPFEVAKRVEARAAVSRSYWEQLSKLNRSPAHQSALQRFARAASKARKCRCLQ